MKYVLFVLVVGTVTVALVIDLIVLVWWLRRAAMNAFAAIGKKLFAGQEGPFLGGAKGVPSGRKRAKSAIKSTRARGGSANYHTHSCSQNPAKTRTSHKPPDSTFVEHCGNMHTAM